MADSYWQALNLRDKKGDSTDRKIQCLEVSMAEYSVGTLVASAVVRLWLLHSSKAKCLWNALQAQQHIQKIVARRDH